MHRWEVFLVYAFFYSEASQIVEAFYNESETLEWLRELLIHRGTGYIPESEITDLPNETKLAQVTKTGFVLIVHSMS